MFGRLQQLERTVRPPVAKNGSDADDDEPRPALTVEFVGGYAIALETEAVVKRESIMNSVGSLALIVPLLFVIFRSVWLAALGALPSALSLVVTLGAMGFAGLTLSAAATGAAAMLFGLGVDGVVLVYVSYRLGLADGLTPDAAIAGTAAPSLSMLLGMMTTAATFLGLMFVDFPSLQELGRLIGLSMALCGVFTLVLVPALLPKRVPRGTVRSISMPALSRWIVKHHRIVVACGALLTVALGAAAVRLRINPSLERLRSTTGAAGRGTADQCRIGLPGDVHVVLSEGTDLEALLTTNERLVTELHRGWATHRCRRRRPAAFSADASWRAAARFAMPACRQPSFVRGSSIPRAPRDSVPMRSNHSRRACRACSIPSSV